MCKFKFLLSALTIVFLVTGCASKNENSDGVLNITQNYADDIYHNQDANILGLLTSIDKKTGKKIGGDCSGFVSLLNKKNGNIYFNEKELYKFIPKSGRKSDGIYRLYLSNNAITYNNPNLGDLIFFYNTVRGTKKSKKKQVTHVGVVRDIYKDGRISFVHNSGGRNIVSYMNLNKKNIHKSGKKVENSYVVNCSRGNISCLSSNRFAGFGNINR